MTNILKKKIVLAVDHAWQVIGVTSVESAIGSMFSSQFGDNLAARALVVDYPEIESGVFDLDEPTGYYFVGIDEWLKLPVRSCDNAIHTPRMSIRIPTVIQSHNCHKIPTKKLKPTKRNLYDMYDGKDIWTGKKLSYNRATIEHMNPKSNGGSDTWGNLAIADKDINNKRGSTPVKEFKYKPQYRLKEPKEVPISALIKELRHRDWRLFINK